MQLDSRLRRGLQKTASGDLDELLYPAQLKKFLDLYNQVNPVWTEMTESELEGMTRTYEGCSGKVPAGTYLSGKKHIENVTAAMNFYMSEIAPKQNDVRAKGLACSGRRWRSE
ncbi:MAG: hypothetical protein ACXW5U_18470 [Thermoanaerobaculia bacterium]